VRQLEKPTKHQKFRPPVTFAGNVRSELAIALGASCSEIGNLHVDERQRTTVAGLYAAGDVGSVLHQLSVAFGHAAIAATSMVTKSEIF